MTGQDSIVGGILYWFFMEINHAINKVAALYREPINTMTVILQMGRASSRHMMPTTRDGEMCKNNYVSACYFLNGWPIIETVASGAGRGRRWRDCTFVYVLAIEKKCEFMIR